MKLPTLTPFQAKQRLKSEGDFTLDGFDYTLDGPMMCPSEMLEPCATDSMGQPFFPAGDYDTPVTESTEWVF